MIPNQRGTFPHYFIPHPFTSSCKLDSIKILLS